MDWSAYDAVALAGSTTFPTPIPRPDPAAILDPEEIPGAEKCLRQFVKLAWHVIEPARAFVEGWHLDALCMHLQAVTDGEIRNLLINVPPRHMKSLTVGVFWPAWEWIRFPGRRWLFSSYAQSLSERDSVSCRRLIESAWYQDRWGGRFALCDDQNTKVRFANTGGGHRIATSVGGSATGEGGDRVVVDDPHNVIDRESEAKRREALAWWDQTMSTRLNDPKTGARVIVMQRIHEKDLSGHVLEQGGYAHLCLPAEYEPSRRGVTSIGWSDPRTVEGELLWAQRIGAKEIADFKTRLGPEGYAGQFQQRPSPAGGGRFRSDWFKYYKCERPDADDLSASHAPSHYRLLQSDGSWRVVCVEDCDRFAVMDPAGTEPGEGRRPCYTVIQVWDVTPAGEMLLVHQYRQQVQAPDAAAAAARVCRQFDVPYIAIEKDGMGLGVVQHVRLERITVRAIKARGSKEARSQTAEIRMAAGTVYFPHAAPFMFELEEELLQFPNSEYADQVDALSHAAMQVRKMGRAGGETEPPDETENRDDDGGWE